MHDLHEARDGPALEQRQRIHTVVLVRGRVGGRGEGLAAVPRGGETREVGRRAPQQAEAAQDHPTGVDVPDGVSLGNQGLELVVVVGHALPEDEPAVGDRDGGGRERDAHTQRVVEPAP